MANGRDGTNGARASGRVEWPTLVVAMAIAAGAVATIATHRWVPAGVTVGMLGVLTAWYGSLRHEIVHGHPTPWRRFNVALVAVPLGLTEPFWHYRELHVRHHETENLTKPTDDPESQYLSAAVWSATRPIVRVVRQLNMTLAGRMLFGPWIGAATVARSLARQWADGRRRWSIVRFVVADVAVLVTVWSTGLPLWQYVLGVAYLGTSLTLIRSFAEHRAVPVGSRTAVVLGRGFWALLFLNNNLHVTHHRQPDLAWYRLPAAHAAGDADRVAADGAGLYRSYAEIFRAYLFRRVSGVVDPLDREPVTLQT